MIKNWLLAARPKTLIAGFSPIAIGTVLAWMHGGFDVGAMLLALLGAVSVQVGTNFCNDYFDFFQGADTDERKGPTRAVQAGLISPKSMLLATVLMFCVTAGAAYCLYLRAGWFYLLIGMFSIVFGVLYTAGKFSLAYLGLGEPFVLLFFGPVAVAGTYYAQVLKFDSSTVVAGLGPGFLAMALLVVNNLRDVEEDRKADKRTLVVRFGVAFGRLQYASCIAASVIIPVVFASMTSAWPALLGALVGIPGIFVARKVYRCSGAELRPCLGMTAGLLLAYTTLFCIGVGLAAGQS